MSCRVSVIHTASISVSSDDKGLCQMRVYDCESDVHGTSNLIAATPELCPSECLACTLGVMEPPRWTAKHGTKTGRPTLSLCGDCAPQEPWSCVYGLRSGQTQSKENAIHPETPIESKGLVSWQRELAHPRKATATLRQPPGRRESRPTARGGE